MSSANPENSERVPNEADLRMGETIADRLWNLSFGSDRCPECYLERVTERKQEVHTCITMREVVGFLDELAACARDCGHGPENMEKGCALCVIAAWPRRAA